MAQINEFLSLIDFEAIREYCMANGKTVSYAKGDCFTMPKVSGDTLASLNPAISNNESILQTGYGNVTDFFDGAFGVATSGDPTFVGGLLRKPRRG